jgi:hypothetical protein
MRESPLASTGPRRAPLAAGVVALALAAGELAAFTLPVPHRTWDADPNVIVDSRGNPTVADGAGGRNFVRSAIVSSVAWNGAGAGTVVKATIGSVAGFDIGDGVPMLDFQDPFGFCQGPCLAATAVLTVPRANGTDRIVDGDIMTNPAQDFASAGEPCGIDEYRIEGVMVHEIGHFLGIGHSAVGGATMFPGVFPCTNGPETTEVDDESALNVLYGPPVTE